MRTAALAGVAIVLLATAFAARADDSGSESEQRVQRGIELRRVGKNREALDEFERAYAVHPTPRVGAQIALAHQALADWVEAERGIEGALGASTDVWIVNYRDVLEQALTTVRAHLGSLYVETNVAQGELRLNGSPSEPLPARDQPIRVPAGTSRFELRSPGYVAVARTVDVAAGAQVHVVIELEPAASPGSTNASAAPNGSAARAQSAASRDGAGATEVALNAPRDTRRRTWAYVAFAAGGALAAAGAVAAYVHEANAAIFNNDSRCVIVPETRGQRCGGYEHTANLAGGLEVGAFAGAIGGGAFGAWLLWWPQAWWPRAWWPHFGSGQAAAYKPRSRSALVACAPWSTFGVQCATRF